MKEKIEHMVFGKPVVIEKMDPSIPKYAPFKLPIEYLAETDKHILSEVVQTDLELVSPDPSLGTKGGMYDHLFKPTNEFGKDMIGYWKNHFTTRVDFLSDTQRVIDTLADYKKNIQSKPIDCHILKTIWKDTKEDPHFLEKYSYMDWSMVKHLNESTRFLQLISIINIISPVISLFIPILFLVLPFIILKIQRVKITVSVYIETLKEMAKNHFIGKTIASIQKISFDKLIYIVFTFGLYLMQIYQNVNSCIRFHRNVSKINTQLNDMCSHIAHSIESMKVFAKLNRDKDTYNGFIADLDKYSGDLSKIHEMLVLVKPYKNTISKVWEMGYMLRCYYEIYNNPVFGDAIKYSFGFMGYIDNMSGLHTNFEKGKVSPTTFISDDESTAIESQYYPAYVDASNAVVNDCSFGINMIITGPNAAGKTTLLKTSIINIIFSQQVGYGFYGACRLNPYTHIHSYLNIPDTSGRDSLFQAESRRCKEIVDIITESQSNMPKSRHYCIFDELYSGTNPEEATQSAYSFLLYLSKKENVDFVLTTHYFDLCHLFEESDRVDNYKMDVEKDATSGKIKYTYKLKRGISDIHGAIKILEDMNYPEEILQNIYKMSETSKKDKKDGASKRKVAKVKRTM
jgi:hypothetical protein